MADDDGPGPPSGGGGGKKVLGIPRTYLIVGGVALAGGLAWMWWERTHGKKTGSSSTSTTVITGSVSSNTGISGSMLNAILKDWQQNPGSSSTATGTGTGPKKSTTTKTTTPPPAKKTTKTSTPTPPGKVTTPLKITGYKSVTVKAGQTLDDIAKEYGISPAELAGQNVYVKGEVPGDKKVGQTLGTGAGLKTGQVLKVPVYGK